MQITLNHTDLLDVLPVIEKGLPGKTTFPITEGIYMEGKGDTLTFCSNNFEMAVKTSVPVTGIADGVAVLPKRFIDIAKQLPDHKVTLTLKDSKAAIKSGKSNFKLNCIGTPEEFPLLDDGYRTYPFIEFDGETLKEIINKTTFCVSTDIGKQMFYGVHVTNDPATGFICCASDTYRLAYYQAPESIPGESFQVLIPGKMLNDIGKIIKADNKVRIYIGKNNVVFVVSEFEISVRLLDGNYPNFANAFPDGYQTKITVNKQALLHTLNRARIIANIGNEAVSFSITENELTISTQSETGAMREPLIIDVDGEELDQILINAKFVLEGAKVFDEDNLTVEFNGDTGAVVMKTEGFKYLVLPIKKS